MLNTTRAADDPHRVTAAVATRPRMAQRWVVAVVGTFLLANLAACGSNVKRKEVSPVAVVPQIDRNCNDMPALQQAPGTQGSSDLRAVARVDVDGAESGQPVQVWPVVYFDFDSDVVHDEFTATLEANAKILVANNSHKLRLEGHADERGGREYNLALGQRRSEAVRRILSMMGVKESQMEAVSYGEERPAVVGFDEAAYAKNRRVELIYR